MSSYGIKIEASGTKAKPSAVRRLLPVVVMAVLIGVVYGSGLHRNLSLEMLVQHRARIDAFITAHYLASLAIFAATYLVVVALSIPVSLFLTVSSGILFGPYVGAVVSILGATAGASIVFLVAKTAAGDFLVRRAGRAVEKLADGFRANAFSYLLFLRLVPLFPFWLVNLAPALFGVRLRTFVFGTLIGAFPGAAAFAFVGAGLDSVIAAQEASFRTCLATGRSDCKLNFDIQDAVTPEIVAAFVALGVVALIPVLARRWQAWRVAQSQ
jgi:uncharacterized membrane protein YdjX (TVP38/TMEM64 family)